MLFICHIYFFFCVFLPLYSLHSEWRYMRDNFYINRNGLFFVLMWGSMAFLLIKTFVFKKCYCTLMVRQKRGAINNLILWRLTELIKIIKMDLVFFCAGHKSYKNDFNTFCYINHMPRYFHVYLGAVWKFFFIKKYITK